MNTAQKQSVSPMDLHETTAVSSDKISKTHRHAYQLLAPQAAATETDTTCKCNAKLRVAAYGLIATCPMSGTKANFDATAGQRKAKGPSVPATHYIARDPSAMAHLSQASHINAISCQAECERSLTAYLAKPCWPNRRTPNRGEAFLKQFF